MGSSPTYENKISPQYRLGSFLDLQKKGVRLKVSGTQEDPPYFYTLLTRGLGGK